MRVGIVTQPLEMNYGGILQNWALQQVLQRMGHAPITIDAYERYSTPHYLFNCMQVLWARMRGKNRRFPKRYYGSLRKNTTGEFVERHITKTRVMWHYRRSVVKRYHLDALLVGSDQVWRAKYNGDHLEDMYLRFAEGLPLKRVAYAASFGIDQWEYNDEQTQACARLAQQMDAISVREPSAVALCRERLGVESTCVLDPTLLLDAADYESLITSPANHGDDYLAVYCLDVTPAKKAFVDRLAKERGLQARYFSAGWSADVTVEEWLAIFSRSSMVVTDSFHGTVFSILFKKDFYTLCNPDRGNARIQGLLRQLDLERRLVSEIEPVEPSEQGIAWADVYTYLQALRDESLQFLSHALPTDN